MDDGVHSVEAHYDELADHWDVFTEVAWKERVLWPTVQSLLPALSGQRALDVGCGDGTYSARLADEGADVLGVDLSEEMVRVARENYGDRAEFRRADVTESLSSVGDDSVDVVLCQHVFSHLPAIETPLSEFARVLAPGGSLVVTTHHPFHDFLVVDEREYPDTSAIDEMELEPVVEPAPDDPNYHETERFEIHWGGPDSSNPGTYYRRPLGALLQPLLDAGFSLRTVDEPDLGTFEADLPDVAAALRTRPPRSVCLRAER